MPSAPLPASPRGIACCSCSATAPPPNVVKHMTPGLGELLQMVLSTGHDVLLSRVC